MNKIIITGNLCKDIELRYTNNNIQVVQNAVGVRNDFKNKNGEYDSEFINIVAYRNSADFLNKYAIKGSKVLIEGRLTNRSYDKQDGTKGYVSEVVVEKIEILDKKKKEDTILIQNSTKEEDPFSAYEETVVIDDNFLD